MALVIPPGFGHVIHSMSLAGDPEPVATTYGVDFSEGGPTLAALANFLHDTFFTSFASKFSVDYALEATTIRYATGETANPEGVEVHVERNQFQGNVAPLPQNCAYLVRKRSGLAGRRRQGRMYLPPPPDDQVNAVGRINAQQVVTMQDSANTFLSALNTSANLTGMVILHSTGLTSVPVPTPVSSLTVDPIIATQRRRLRS